MSEHRELDPDRTADRGESPSGSRRLFEEVLPRFSLDRRITVLVLIATLAVLGVVAVVSIPLELIPGGYSEPFLRVAAPWRDAPPQEVLDKIVLPLEEELATVGGMQDLYSFARTGYGQVFMTFKYGTDMDIAYREVRDRVERARAKLPEDVEQIWVRKDDDASIPVAMIGIGVDEGISDPYQLIQNEIVLPLERIEGVAAISADGLEQKEVLIELDRERVAASGLNIFEIAQDLASDNFTMASGSVRAGSRKLLLRSVARYRDPGSVQDLMVAPGVRLSDIATVRYAIPERDYSVRVNSKPAFALAVMKEGEANTLEVAERVDAVVAELQSNPRLQGVEMDVIMDQGSIIRSSLDVLLDSGRIGAVLAMVVLFFFLRRVRLSLLVAVSIPLSLLVGLVAMYFAGESLNILSLLGLMISVGLLVDNSVVVAENIHRLYRDEGLPRREAAIRGAGEIALAIVTATLTTIVVFLPVALVDGQGQFFLLRLAIPISVSLAASLLVALVVVPLGVYLALPSRAAIQRSPGPKKRASDLLHASLRRVYDHSFGVLNRWYGGALTHFLRRRLDLLLVLVALFGLTQLWARDRIEIVPMNEEEMSFFEIWVELPDGLVFEEARAWFRQAEGRIAEIKDELGLNFYLIFHRTAFGEIQGALASDRATKIGPREVTERILAVLPELPGIEFHTGMASEKESERDLAVEVLTLQGEDAEELDRVALQLEERSRELPGVLGVKRSSERQPNELALELDRDLVQRQGVNPTSLAGMVGYALRGQALPRVYLRGRDIPVRVRFEEEDRAGLAELANFEVPGAEGPVNLGALVEARPLETATSIRRRNKQTSRRVTLELETGREEEARRHLRALKASVDLPEGVHFGAPRARGRQSDEARNLQFAMVLSIVFVYLLMGFLFESFVLPLSILITVPLATLGVTWSHLLASRPIDFLGMVGVVILIGVVVNNGIVLIDYVHRLRAQGMERTEALLLAAERRFRPIMMTTLTTICGMVPLILGKPLEIGLSYKSFGLTLVGGMATSSLLTLLVVPVLYTAIEDGRGALSRALGGAFRSGSAAAARPAGEASLESP